MQGIVTGWLSRALAVPLPFAVSSYMGDFIGMMAFRISLGLVVNYKAIALWALLLASGSAATTLFHAIRSGRMSTREALAYEQYLGMPKRKGPRKSAVLSFCTTVAKIQITSFSILRHYIRVLNRYSGVQLSLFIVRTIGFIRVCTFFFRSCPTASVPFVLAIK